MATHRDHHYVPAFLLREWEGPPDDKLSGFWWANGKLQARRYKAKSVASELGLYSMRSSEGVVDNTIEREFLGRHVDAPAADVHKILLSGASPPKLSEAQRSDWSRLLVSLLIRTPRMISVLKARGVEVIDQSLSESPHEYDAIRAEDDPPSLIEWVAKFAPLTLENAPIATLPDIIDSTLLNSAIVKATWGTFQIQPPNHQLIIGDEPLAYYGTLDSSFLLAVPISPRKFFVSFNNIETGKRIRSRSQDAMARDLNDHQASNAQRFVFATDASVARFIEKRLRRPANH